MCKLFQVSYHLLYNGRESDFNFLIVISCTYSGDFMIEFHYSPKNTVSVHERLYEMTSAMLERSNKLQEMRDKNTNGIYRRILWSK